MKNSTQKDGSERKPLRLGEKCLFYLGAVALLFAMATDTLAVLGRHIGVPLWGSIELVQAGILIASSTAMLSATLAKKHAKVRILVNRLHGGPLLWLQWAQALFSAVFFLALLVGSFWIFLDMRGAYEESELLHIPYTPLRIICILSIFGVMLSFVRRLTESPKQ
jgi:TRAP-type transport system small permease protein